MSDPFDLLDVRSLSEDLDERQRRIEARQARLREQRDEGTLRRPAEAALKYQASEALRVAINTALALDMPLLVAGEPGTGKTQVAWFIAAAFGLEDPHVVPVRSTSTYRDLLYTFDAVGDFRDAQDQERKGNRAEHVKPGPLWEALTSETPRVLLVDEVDKAPRDFPNDLLDVLDRISFEVPELARAHPDDVRHRFPELTRLGEERWRVKKPKGHRNPIVVLTTNSERRLPEPFLRRCIFHWIEFSKDLLQKAVDARRSSDFTGLDDDTEKNAIRAFMRLREHEPELRKKPSTAEFLAWLSLLTRDPKARVGLDGTPELATLPYLRTLVKTQEDLNLLRVKGA